MKEQAIIIIFLIGVFSILNWTYTIQLKFGNWLYIHYPKSWLRKIWWSEYDTYRDYEMEQEIIKKYQLKKEINLLTSKVIAIQSINWIRKKLDKTLKK